MGQMPERHRKILIRLLEFLRSTASIQSEGREQMMEVCITLGSYFHPFLLQPEEISKWERLCVTNPIPELVGRMIQNQPELCGRVAALQTFAS